MLIQIVGEQRGDPSGWEIPLDAQLLSGRTGIFNPYMTLVLRGCAGVASSLTTMLD